MPALMRRGREARRLRRELDRLEDRLKHPVTPTAAVAPETIAPMAPL
jgi:hypothetical protein